MRNGNFERPIYIHYGPSEPSYGPTVRGYKQLIWESPTEVPKCWKSIGFEDVVALYEDGGTDGPQNLHVYVYIPSHDLNIARQRRMLAAPRFARHHAAGAGTFTVNRPLHVHGIVIFLL